MSRSRRQSRAGGEEFGGNGMSQRPEPHGPRQAGRHFFAPAARPPHEAGNPAGAGGGNEGRTDFVRAPGKRMV